MESKPTDVYLHDPAIPTPRGRQATPERIKWLLARPNVTPREAVEVLGKSRNTIDAWIARGMFDTFCSGPRNGCINIVTSSILGFLADPAHWRPEPQARLRQDDPHKAQWSGADLRQEKTRRA